jgi:uncharacterized protein (TIGR02266 family)
MEPWPEAFMVTSNRRKNPRVPCVCEVKVLGPRGSVRGTTKNISVGGVYVASKDLLPIGTSCEADITFQGQKMRALVEVRHHQRLDDQPGMGLKFVRLEPSMLAAVQKFVEANAGSVVP